MTANVASTEDPLLDAIVPTCEQSLDQRKNTLVREIDHLRLIEISVLPISSARHLTVSLLSEGILPPSAARIIF